MLTEDWEGKNYCGIDLEWDYVNRHVTLSIDGYVLRGLQRFAQLLDLNTKGKPKRLQHAPSKHTAPKYGAKVQYAKEPDTSEPLSKERIKLLMEIIGVFLFYARAIDNTMLVALGTLGSAQSKGTDNTMQAAVHLTTTQRPIRMPRSGTMQVRCNSILTATPHISPNPKHAHALEDTSS